MTFADELAAALHAAEQANARLMAENLRLTEDNVRLRREAAAAPY